VAVCLPGRRGRFDLDNRASYQHLDPNGMLDFAVEFPSQVEEAARIGRQFAPPRSLRNPSEIVIAGMGGSAVVGDFLARLLEDRAPVPVLVCRNYEIPRSVGPRTLFIASSHSGNTEETLSAVARARRRRARIVCITTNGKLAESARRNRIPLLEIPQTDPPMPPRAALGYSLIPLVVFLGSVNLYPGAASQLREVPPLLRRLRDQVGPEAPRRRNRAKTLATQLHGKLPWVQGTAGIMSAAAYRWRCQFNENSKVLAYSSEYPELNHNEVVGWELPRARAQEVRAIVLHRSPEPRRIRARLDITQEMIGRKTRVHAIEAEGRSALAQLMWTVYLGDFVSLYLAFLNRVDPSSIAAIDELKSRLAQL